MNKWHPTDDNQRIHQKDNTNEISTIEIVKVMLLKTLFILQSSYLAYCYNIMILPDLLNIPFLSLHVTDKIKNSYMYKKQDHDKKLKHFMSTAASRCYCPATFCPTNVLTYTFSPLFWDRLCCELQLLLWWKRRPNKVHFSYTLSHSLNAFAKKSCGNKRVGRKVEGRTVVAPGIQLLDRIPLPYSWTSTIPETIQQIIMFWRISLNQYCIRSWTG
jgi:hypothetical protein